MHQEEIGQDKNMNESKLKDILGQVENLLQALEVYVDNESF